MMLYFSILTLVGGSVYLLSVTILELRRQPRLRGLAATAPKRFSLSSLKILKPLIILTRPLTKLPYLKTLHDQAEILRINMDVAGLVLQKIFLAVFAGVLVFIFFPATAYWMIAVLVGFFLPDFVIVAKVRSKKQAIVRVFPETVDLIDLCIGAGLDFTSSIKWVQEKSNPNPFIEQLETVLQEIQVGRNRTDSLKDMARRLQLPDISSFVRTVIQSERMGTSVEEAFRNLSEDTRLMRYQSGERYAIKASLKILFPLLFCILPVIMIVVAGPIIIKFSSGDLFPKSF